MYVPGTTRDMSASWRYVQYADLSASAAPFTPFDFTPLCNPVAKQPFFEADSTWDPKTFSVVSSVRARQKAMGWRVFNTHIWWKYLPGTKQTSTDKKGGPRYIYVSRNAPDSCVSFYHHLSQQLQKGTSNDPPTRHEKKRPAYLNTVPMHFRAYASFV
jgi:hypothetical protein